MKTNLKFRQKCKIDSQFKISTKMFVTVRRELLFQMMGSETIGFETLQSSIIGERRVE